MYPASVVKKNYAFYWIVIYLTDSIIQALNNQAIVSKYQRKVLENTVPDSEY